MFLWALMGLLILYLIASSYMFAKYEGADAPECRTVSMYPSYARIRSFDEQHTKFASKYSLWLYREQGKDLIPEKEGEGFEALDGIPILFIPGNAGSYRQVRLIAAETSILFFDENINVVDNDKQKNYDFFAADFNEDYLAFHGRTILDQAEFLNDAVAFILLLYAKHETPPTSLILIGHSMGGIVARLMLTLPNYVPGSVNTILTLSSPHSAPPLTFDGDLLRVYSKIDQFWYDGFHLQLTLPVPSLAQQRLHNVSVISITGGLLDTILPADYTTLGYLVPPSNGFTVFTTGIPDVWTPSDHLAIVWCRQLRRLIAGWLLSIADITSPHRTVPLEKRMRILRDIFMTGFEKYTEQDIGESGDFVQLTLAASDVDMHGPNLVVRLDNQNEHSLRKNIFKLEPDATFHFLSLHRLTTWEESATAETETSSLLLCRNANEGREGERFNISAEHRCLDLYSYIRQVPRLSKDVERIMDSSFDGEKNPFYALKLEPQVLGKYDMIVMHEPFKAPVSHFAIAQLTSANNTNATMESDLSGLLLKDVKKTLPKDRLMAFNIYIPGAWSSVLAYKVVFKNLDLEEHSFTPFIREWRDDPYESKWYINIRNDKATHLSVHAVAPYTPFQNTRTQQGINLELWAEPGFSSKDDSSKDVVVIFSVDFWGSLKLLVLRYRLAVVAHCLAVSLLIFVFQLLKYYETGKFPDHMYGLGCICNFKWLLMIFIVLGSLTSVVKNGVVQSILNRIDPVTLHSKNEIHVSLHPEYTLHTLYLGLEEGCLWFFGPLFFTVALGINWLGYNLLLLAGSAIVYLGRITRLLSRNLEEKESQHVKVRKSKVGGMVLLMVLVSFYLPYQFAYVISLTVQVVTVVKLMANRNARTALNFNMGVMMVMLWVLPISIPVLIVFVHNFNINWATPFSSHHNLLAIAPIFALVLLQSQYKEWIPLPKKGDGKDLYFKTIVAMLMYTIFYCMVYGVRHTYWLHHLFNFTCGLMLPGYIDRFVDPKSTK